MRDNGTYNPIFGCNVAHTPTHTKESPYQRHSSEKANIATEKREME